MGRNNRVSSLIKSICVAKTEYVKWVCNPKMLMYFVMYIFIYDMVVRKMINAADEMGTRIMIAEPFIAISNSILLLFIIPFVYLALMGDFPRVDGNSMFYLQRVGKKSWMLGQFFFSIMASCTYVFVLIVSTMICVANNCTYNNKWSLVTTKYSKFFPDRTEGFIANLITGRLYNNYRPYEAMAISAILMILYMILISVMLMTGFAIGKRSINLGIVGIILSIGSAIVQVSIKEKWLFPAAHTLPWIHFDLIYNKQIFPVQYSILYMVLMIVCLYVIDYLLIDRYDFSKIEEMEE